MTYKFFREIMDEVIARLDVIGSEQQVLMFVRMCGININKLY